jgi:hypothetical protein
LELKNIGNSGKFKLYLYRIEDVETAIFIPAAAEPVTAGRHTQHHAVYTVKKTVLPVYVALCIQ